MATLSLPFYIMVSLLTMPVALSSPRCRVVAEVQGRQVVLNENVKALLFDCDGTVAETEQTLTLAQFNLAFASTPGLRQVRWTEREYGDLLKAGTSPARFKTYFDANPELWPLDCLFSDEKKNLFAEKMKHVKDDMFEVAMKSQGILSLRPGIAQLIDSAFENGLGVAVCSNSNTEPVKRICSTLLGGNRTDRIIFQCGDMQEYKSRKKPDPLMYLNACSILGTLPSQCLVFEDSEVGLSAATAAGMSCVVTPSYYTLGDNFDTAALVCTDLETAKLSLTSV